MSPSTTIPSTPTRPPARPPTRSRSPKPTPAPTRTRTPRRALSPFMPTVVLTLIAFVAFLPLPLVSAVKFQVEAHHDPPQKCLWNYAMTDTLVVISVSAPMVTSMQRLDMEVVDGSGSRNIYQSKKGLKGETRMAVTTHADADLGVCFRNVLDPSVPEGDAHKHVRAIDLDVDIGADAVDYNAIAKQESLSGLEVEMRKLEGVVKEIVEELNYLKRREARMRDTNESTNDRVRNFFFMTFTLLILLGIWQILHLRSYFKKKYLID